MRCSARDGISTLVLETEFQTATGTGSAAVIDFMPPADGAHLVQIVVGRSGRVYFQNELVVRPSYGASVPRVNRLDDGAINAIAGPDGAQAVRSSACAL
jgi:hypothetical protein